MKTKLISIALALSMLLCPISVSAAGFLIGNPTVSGISYSYYSQGMIAFGYGDSVSFGDDLTVCFNDMASRYIVFSKALTDAPDETAASEPGTLLEDYSYYGNNPLYRNSLTIPATVLEEYAGQYLKISIQAVESNGDYSWIVNTYYYLEPEYETNWYDDYEDEDQWWDDPWGNLGNSWEDDLTEDYANNTLAMPDPPAEYNSACNAVVFKPGSGIMYAGGYQQAMTSTVKNGVTYVPVWDIFSGGGWCSSMGSISSLQKWSYDLDSGSELELFSGSRTAYCNGVSSTLSNAPYTDGDNVLYAAVRDIATYIQASVLYDHNSKYCIILDSAYTGQAEQILRETLAEYGISLGNVNFNQTNTGTAVPQSSQTTQPAPSASADPAGNTVNPDTEIKDKLNQLRSMLVQTLFHSDLDAPLRLYDNYIDSAWSFGAASFFDTVVNIDDLFKGDMQMSKSIRAVDMLLSSMDGGKAEEELSFTNSFISIFDASLFANINNYDSETRLAVKALQTALSRVDADWASSQAMHGITAAMYQNLLQTIPSLDNSTIWTLLCLRDDSAAKFSDIGKLRRGLSRLSHLLDKFDSFSDKVQIAADLFTIFSDYSLQIDKLKTIRACADPANTELYDAISEREAFYEDAFIRIGHVFKDASLDITLEAVEKANIIWAATSTAFKLMPIAASTSEAVMLTASFDELAQSSESYILNQIDYMTRTCQYGELSDLEDELHMYSDLRILLNGLGKKLTLDSNTKDYLDDLSDLVNSIESDISSRLEEIHSLVNSK